MDKQQKTPYNNPNEIEDLDEEDVIPPVHLDKSFSRYIIVDNLPIIPREKEAKLLAVVKKIFGSAGNIKDVFMPYEDNEDKSKGFAFIEYSKAEEADLAVKQTNDVKLDAKHTLKVNHFEDVDKLQTLGDKYTPPETQEYQPAENLREWLLNPDGVDQFVIRYMNETEIYWNSFIGNKPKLEFKRTDWTESYLSWSQQGTYLATLHRLGVILWGGPKWTKYQKFHHPGVKLIDFSPCEKYIVTYSQQAEQESKDQAIIIWDVITGQKMRAFPNLNPAWPAFKWSHDDKFFARVNEEGALSIYETNTFSLINKKSYKLDAAIHDFAWSPSDNIISAWVPEYNNIPARVFLLQVPQLTVVSQKNLYNVIDAKMHWQGAGDYLCVKVDRHSGKNKAKTAVTNFELFRMREKGLPIEVLELKDEIVIAFAWEPKDKRFALIHCPEDSPRTNVSFYTMAGKQYKHLKTLEKRSANHLFWSPAGKYILIAGLRNFNGVLEFFSVQDLETITTEDHFNCTNIEWDPTGRYVATYVSFWRHPLENGYNLWTFSGKHLHREYREKFYQLLWRPRPPSLLSKEVEENIKKNFKQISDKYRKEDEARIEEQRRAELERKAKLRSDYENLLRQRWAEYKADAPKRRAITGHDDVDEENEYLLVEEEVEEVIDEQVIEEY